MRVIIGDRLRARVRADRGDVAEQALDALAASLTPHLYLVLGRDDFPADLVSDVVVDDGGPDFTLSTLLVAALNTLADNGSEHPKRIPKRSAEEPVPMSFELEYFEPDQMLLWYNPWAPGFGNADVERAAVQARLDAALVSTPGAVAWGGSDWDWTVYLEGE